MSTSTHLEETASPRYGAPKSRGTVIHAGRAIAVVFYVTVAARLLSIVSQVLTASTFGAGPNMDAYTVALIVPTTISGILTAAVGAALIPVFVDYRENKGEAESMRLLWAAMTLGTLIALAVTAALVAGAPMVVTLFARQMDAPTQTLAVILLRFLMPVLLLQVLVTLVGSVLNAYGRFALPSLASATITLSTIAFLLFARSWGIYALGWATIVGYSLNFLLLVVAYLRMGLRFHFEFSWRHPGIQRIAALSTPMLIGSLLVNGNNLVDQFMASLLPPGSIASFSYAIKLVDMPSGIFYTALSTALLPIFALQVARREFTLLTTTFRQVVIFSAIILLPAGALLSSLSRPVVEIFYHHGNFSAQATDVVASAVMFLAPNIFIVTYGFINGRIYNALQDNRTLRNVAVLSLVLNAVLDYLLMQIWGVAGIAFATTLTYLIGALTLLLILNKRLQGLRLPQLGLSLGKTAVAAAVLWLTCAVLAMLPQVAALPQLVQIVLLSAAGLVIYAALLRALRVPEVGELWAILCNRLPWGRVRAKPA
ncbi:MULTISPECIES: murein biosynthesis integral membrane protein MurJ [unclassified Bradyrhizobium]